MTATLKQHPVWVKACANSWIDTADQAKLIRATLAARFPLVKFYVRMQRFAGGSSITVYYDGLDHMAPIDSCRCLAGPTIKWPDRCEACGYVGRETPVYKSGQPTRQEVEEITGPFVGGHFDGMIDLAYSCSTWLRPDGSACFGRSEGTGGSHGSDPGYSEARPEPGAMLVNFSAHYVSVVTSLPYDMRAD